MTVSLPAKRASGPPARRAGEGGLAEGVGGHDDTGGELVDKCLLISDSRSNLHHINDFFNSDFRIAINAVDPEKVSLSTGGNHPSQTTPDNLEQKKAQKSCRPPEQLPDIHSGRTQDGIYRVSERTLQTVSVHPVFLLQVPDAGLDRGPALHPFPKGFGDFASSPFIDMDLGITRVIMASQVLSNASSKPAQSTILDNFTSSCLGFTNLVNST